MSDVLFKLLDEATPEHVDLFNMIKNRLFGEYSHDKKIIKKNNLWGPLNEITKELFGTKLDRDGFEVLYSDIDPYSNGYITKKQFDVIARCLIMSLITYVEKKYPIPGREISLCLEEGELPAQLEIIDTLTPEEIRRYTTKRDAGINRNRKRNYRKRHKYRKRKTNKNRVDNGSKIHKSSTSNCSLIEIDSDDEI